MHRIAGELEAIRPPRGQKRCIIRPFALMASVCGPESPLALELRPSTVGSAAGSAHMSEQGAWRPKRYAAGMPTASFTIRPPGGNTAISFHQLLCVQVPRVCLYRAKKNFILEPLKPRSYHWYMLFFWFAYLRMIALPAGEKVCGLSFSSRLAPQRVYGKLRVVRSHLNVRSWSLWRP